MLYRPFTAMLVEVFFARIYPCLFVIIVKHEHFSYISQGSVKTHLRCGAIYNNHIIANYSQSVQWKNFENGQ